MKMVCCYLPLLFGLASLPAHADSSGNFPGWGAAKSTAVIVPHDPLTE